MAGGLVGAALAVGVMLILQRDGAGRNRSGPIQLASVSVSRQAPSPTPSTTVWALGEPDPVTTTTAAPTTTRLTRPIPATTTTTVAVPVLPPTTTMAPAPAPVAPIMVAARSASHPGPIGAVVLSAEMVAIPSGMIGTDLDVWVSWPDGAEVLGRVFGSDPNTGTTLVAVTTTGLPSAPTSRSTTLGTGSQVHLLGPDGTTAMATITEVGCSATGLDGGQLWAMLSIDQPVAAGVLVHDGTSVLGLVVAPDDDGVGSIVAPIEVLAAMEQTRRETGTVQRAWLGMSVGGDGTAAPTVTEIQPGSPAELAGLAVGDTMVSINGQPIDGAGRFLLVAWASTGSPVVIEVDRAGTRVSTSVTPVLRAVELSASATAGG